jgi:F0F1-type ATP synthase assembly protein I
MLEIEFSERNNMSSYQKALRLISSMAVSSVLAIFIGNWLDGIFGTSPWILLALLVYAIGGSLYLLIKDLGDENG